MIGSLYASALKELRIPPGRTDQLALESPKRLPERQRGWFLPKLKRQYSTTIYYVNPTSVFQAERDVTYCWSKGSYPSPRCVVQRFLVVSGSAKFMPLSLSARFFHRSTW